MAQQDNGPCWDSLPSVIMLEIFSYLPHQDRLKASVVCKNWRQALFHPSFWKEITFAFEHREGVTWTRYLAECFALSVQNATVRCWTPQRTSDFDRLLKRFRGNRNLRRLIMEPTSSSLEWQTNAPEDGDLSERWVRPILDSLVKIINTSKHLEALTLGCFEELTARSGEIVSALCSNGHERFITHLGLASVKDDPEDYECAIIDPPTLRSFDRLTVLTIDYDNLSDSLLGALAYGVLRRLVVHVHSWNKSLPGTTNTAWQTFTQKNPQCTLRLNLLHAYVAVDVLDTEILRPAMPLTRFKALFCESVNVKALLRMSIWYIRTLKSIAWIDSMSADEVVPPTHDSSVADSPDALVLIAWKCTCFRELIYIGHKYYPENMLAIARLRGKTLQKFEFAESDIIYDKDSPYGSKNIRKELKWIFGDEWKTLADDELATVITDAIRGDSRDVIMPLVLQDAK
ncbi:F-box only protein 33 [Venturia canescens]|uniref:F-box only protein 33 n=1 Tax=Venturia canescens TaxID=32260 RepID=UPI001C9BFF03|nr:F-box only protein 33 [Venturia canescens]